MTGYNYPDNLYADHLAKQTPTNAYDARSVPRHHIASAIDNLTKAVEYLQVTVRDLRKQALVELAAESQRLGLYDDSVCTSGERVQKTTKRVHDDLPPMLAEALREFGVGDVPVAGRVHVSGTSKNLGHVPRPVLAAEADRLTKPEDML